jgi:N utilization substance protein B
MISRRIIRTKALHILYAHYSSSGRTIQQSETELNFSIKKTYDLYHLLFDLLIEISKYAEKIMENRKLKNFPTEEELNPNTRFIENRVVNKLKENENLLKYLEQNKLSWINQEEFIRKIYIGLTESEFYQKYMSDTVNDYQHDKKLCDHFFGELLLKDDLLFNEMEEQSIYWNDDLDFVISMVLKTLRKFSNTSDSSQSLLSLYKDEEDQEFTKNLFRKTILKHDENRKTIESYTKNWDVDRVALMDILIMELAITELTVFTAIPVKVTLNEYIELSKYYSTERSSNFINGVLDRISKDFKENGKIVKAGRGLLEGK